MQAISLLLQDDVYRAVQQAARSQGRAIEDVLTETIGERFASSPITSVGEDRMALEEEAFEAMRDALWQQYPDQYVAIQDGVVIDHDVDKQTLFQRVRAGRPPDEIVLLKQVTAEPKAPIRWHSFWRLERENGS